MRTIPRRYPFPAPAGERRVMCAYCSMKWYRSDCVRDPSGLLACPDCQEGKDAFTLDRERAEAAAAIAASAAKPGPERW